MANPAQWLGVEGEGEAVPRAGRGSRGEQRMRLSIASHMNKQDVSSQGNQGAALDLNFAGSAGRDFDCHVCLSMI